MPELDPDGLESAGKPKLDLPTRLGASGNLPANLAFDPLFAALRAAARYAKLAAD